MSAKRSRSASTSKPPSPALPHGKPLPVTLSPLLTYAEGEKELPSMSLAENNEGTRKQNKKKKKKSADTNPTSSTDVPVHSSKETVSTIEHFFSRVELYFQLESDVNKRVSLFPRDIANLILWSVPSPVPAIDFPMVFLLKNKSRLREVLVIYVNGWSHDMMMCTGVGLKCDDNNNESNNNTRRWSEPVCSSLLKPVRCGKCWARGEAGVQYAPLYIPNMTNALETDVWWRNDYPKTLQPRANKKRERNAQPDGEADPAQASPDPSEATGVRAMFDIAKEIHRSNPSSPTDAGPKENEKVAEEEEKKKIDAEQQKAVWYNTALLQQYALRLPEHKETLVELNFIVEPPDTTAEKTEEASLASSEPWTQFDCQKKHYQKYKQKGHQNGETPANTYTSYDKSVPSIFALDCEMVLVGQRESVLARATLVDVITEDVVLDMIVKPADAVTDLLTRYSGITEEMLTSCENTLADCQRALKRFIHTDTYVVGHSLDNDFKALKMIPNCYILDSAYLFPHPSGLPYKNALRFLALRYLMRKIQQGSHDSGIDALTSAHLVHLKMLKGPQFGIREKVSVLEIISWNGAPPSKEENENEKSAPEKTEGECVNRGGHVVIPTHVQLFDDAQALSHIMSRHPLCRQCKADPINCRHDEDVTRKVVKALAQRRKIAEQDGEERPFHLAWAQLSTETAVDVLLPEEDPSAYEATQIQKAELTNRRVMRMVKEAVDGTLVLVICGDCRGAEGGNHLSAAHGAVFGFVKDASSKGVTEEYLTAAESEETNTVTEKEKTEEQEAAPPKECQPQ
ncbi:hypothetical protein AGDE_07693 [Angomonas deanei]|uniref:Exonuclease domain-containing protein n=1 Tax=Angomonas deanei TaxID=59799 RepID=A0A7G2CVH1_9TRYP|nr:hypothetical protein AGDE_07693 [Angomonas deanei]CAD2222924.1 hypothetical protein, conserved [Angomonas deanei]|eukprot:EPY34943.1 hypothetical protein AGDE_07693 [Angomonas deanei]